MSETDTINLTQEIKQDEYTEYVIANYDIQDIDTSIPNPKSKIDELEDWNIGLIVGNSGSGKSVILSELGEIYEHSWMTKIPLISNFQDILSPDQACELLSNIGLASIPSWLRRYDTLSTGEKHRADLAMSIAKNSEKVILFDEFTSVVNRDVAKAMSHSLKKYTKKYGIKIILAACHYDIIDWLSPDWIHDCQIGNLVKKRIDTT